MKIGKTTIITEASKVTEIIVSIGTRGKRLDADIHKAGVSSMYHAQQHGDVTLMQKLILALPKSARRKGFIAWVDAHMPVAEATDVKEGTIILKKDRTDDDFAVKDAEGKPFWAFTDEKAPVYLSIDSMIAAFRKQLEKAAKQDGDHEVDSSKLAMLEEACSVAMGENVEEMFDDEEAEVDVDLENVG